MDNNPNPASIDDLKLQKHTNNLPANLIDRITLIHHAFREYLSVTLEQTIHNFTSDNDPEAEVCIWERMASIILHLKYSNGWSGEKVTQAVKLVLGLSMGAIQDNTLNAADTQYIVTCWNQHSSSSL